MPLIALALGYGTKLPAMAPPQPPAAAVSAGPAGAATVPIDARRFGAEAQAMIVAITEGCVPHASGTAAAGAGGRVQAGSNPPARVVQPVDGLTPGDWGKPAFSRVESRSGQVWIAAYPNGNCLVHGWGDVVGPVSVAVRNQFEAPASPWEDVGGGRYRLTLPGRTIEARAHGQEVDRPEIQGDALVAFTVEHGS